MRNRAPFLLLTAVLITVPRVSDAQGSRGVRIPADMHYLADDRLEGRGTGTPGAELAADYISHRFQEIGLRPAPGSTGWFQNYVVSAHSAGGEGSSAAGQNARNVIGVIVGTDPDHADEYIVLGAHYDHLGRGGRGSLDPDSVGVVHNGADDNASGVVALLDVARRLSLQPPALSVLFIAFSGEELGLLGSTAYVKAPWVPMEQVRAMLNFDMVGRLREDKLIVYGVETATEFRPILDSLNGRHRFALSAQGGGYGPSDQTSFTVAGRPVLHFFTGTHTDYHRTTDDWEKINNEGIERVASFATDVVRAIAQRPSLTFVDSPPPPAPSGESRTSGYGAYLGTVPDMSENPGGVLLSGVRAGGPADLAGITGGDIIVKIGDHDVPDLQGMTDALRAYAPGDVVEIVIRRGDAARTVTVTLGRRGG